MKFPRFRRPVSELINWMWERVTWRGIIFPGDRRARRFGAFGDGSLIGFPTGTIYGEKYMHVGSNTIFADHVTLSVGIVSHFRIDIGDGVYTGMNVYITDQNHTYDDIDTPIGRQHPVDEPVRIGSGSWIGSGAIILPGADIGEHVVVAANSVVRGTIPANSVVAGVPAKVVRQHDGEAWSRP